MVIFQCNYGSIRAHCFSVFFFSNVKGRRQKFKNTLDQDIDKIFSNLLYNTSTASAAEPEVLDSNRRSGQVQLRGIKGII